MPKRFQHVDTRGHVRRSLNTRDPDVAARKVPGVIDELHRYWEALDAGAADDAAAAHAAAARLAASRGIVYRPAPDLATGPLLDILERLERIEREGAIADPIVPRADLGAEPVPRLALSGAFDWYAGQVSEKARGKSPAQRRRWEVARRSSIDRLISVVGDKPVADLTRDDALRFRDWCRAKADRGEWRLTSANRMITNIAAIVNKIDEFMRLGIGQPFNGLRFEDTPARRSGGLLR